MNKKLRKSMAAKPKSTKHKTAKSKTSATGKIPKPSSAPKRFSASFPIVGVGASAGGLEAFEDFFSHLDTPAGMAFVVVSHQHPDHTSLLPELLKRCTSMDVVQVADRMEVRPNSVYLNPPGKNVALFNRTFHVSDPTVLRGLSLPIDFFFRSLAQDQGDKAICIILSGTGSDGTLGLRAIKGESGMTMAQDESSSKFFGMPGSAIGTGLVDYTLPPSKMPDQLIKYVKSSFPPSSVSAPRADSSAVMQKIFLQLRHYTGHDFSLYKTNTTSRRVERRMNVHHINNLPLYLKYLKENQQEAQTLFKELLIGVTAFFRDAGAFNYLDKTAIPSFLKSAPDGSGIRIWVPGCASGEEAYSLAILLSEHLKKTKGRRNIQIFATDLDPDAIHVARAGLYPEGIAADVSPERLASCFDKVDGGYRIKKDIRAMVVFAQHNVIKDPPFTKLDLVSCRNLLIYLQSELQKKVLATFHYCLKPGGKLFLGNSESIGSGTLLFKPDNKKWKVFSRSRSSFPLLTASHDIFTHDPVATHREMGGTKLAMQKPAPDLQRLMENQLLSRFVPTSVIVDEQGKIFHIHGKTGAFLEPAQGKPNHNIFAMAREGLKADLTIALRKAHQKNSAIVVENIKVKSNGGHIKVNFTVQKISAPEQLRGLLMVVFEYPKDNASPRPLKRKAGGAKLKKGDASRLDDLEKELQSTRESLQKTIEQFETTYEELKSTNEELQSANEELQSSNEEIETSKEEMQSLNEELQTTNAELQIKIDDYSMVNDDMKNLLNSIHIATVFLDDNLDIKRFTTEAKTIIRLIASDIGRPIGDIVSMLKYGGLVDDCRAVLDTLTPKEIEVQANNGIWYQMRILPYRTSENRIDGLVVTFIDIDKIKKTEALLKDTEESQLLATIIRDSNDAITVQSFDGKILEWNRGAEIMYGYSRSEALNMNILDLVPEKHREEAKIYTQRIARGEPVKSFKSQRRCKSGKTLDVWLTITLIQQTGRTPNSFATTERDISDQPAYNSA
jgi:two-component system CheB/CheR fusion protein